MALYTAQTNSPSTTLSSAAAANATTLSLANGSVFSGLSLPNYLTLGYTQGNSETVLVTAISGDTATVTRGVDGTATDWAVDTPVARVFTAKDWNDMITEKAPTDHASSSTTYGKGTGTNYGHLKLSDSTSSTSSTTGGIAATPKAVSDLASAKQDSITATGVLLGAGSGSVSGATLGGGLSLSSTTLSSAKLTLYTATLAASWTSSNSYYTQTVTVSGLKSSYSVPPIVDVTLSGTDAAADKALVEAWALVDVISTGTNSITAQCTGSAPTVAIPISISVWE